MNRRTLLLLIGLLLVVLAGATGYYYMMNGGRRDIASEESAYSISPETLLAEFTTNANEANKKYLEKPISVSGTITAINTLDVTVGGNVICSFSTAPNLKTGAKITIKGRVVGYDDLMNEIRLDQCALENQQP
ncbi:OB-fold protein [Flavobacterium silvaticum]|uniref:Uncharacterized protein n=1 Tax=Flavobacterium silvaticum TaxID=1852020 RepID=A0A972FVE4_9FLAO|nr:hypothetical protein [Flavobacterium silvaticum]NMH29408.1 hypothetical protein [Flavobacterium silvaticum]